MFQRSHLYLYYTYIYIFTSEAVTVSMNQTYVLVSLPAAASFRDEARKSYLSLGLVNKKTLSLAQRFDRTNDGRCHFDQNILYIL